MTQQIAWAGKSPGAKALFNQHAQLISNDNGKLVFGVSSAAILSSIQTPEKLIHIKKAAENPLLNMGITFGPQLSEAFVPTLPADVRPVVFDFTDWLFAPETLPKHEKKIDK